MSWPTPQDYNEAIQNPGSCFGDAELRLGKPDLTPLGLPKAISGNFASVYQMICGGRRWAVRCFLREIPDQQERYRAIGDHLMAKNLPFIVDFKFLRDGIRVGGTWFPALKMEWIDGDPLHQFVQRNLHRPSALQSLAKQWMSVLLSLRHACIAHGDLQHGNILISNGQIKLIDYDGMYVPSLAGRPSHEEGHRNYQHPRRTGRDFGPHLDAFPGWVILASLAALAVDPRLWPLLDGGDECLIFRREDFENPGRSKALQAIQSSGHFELQTLGKHLTSLLALPIAQIPPADSSSPLILPQHVPTQAEGLPEWLKNNQEAGELSSLAPLTVDFAIPPVTDNGGAAWLIDHLVSSPPISDAWANAAVGPQRTMLVLDAVVLVFVASIVSYGIIPLWFGMVLLIVLAVATGMLFASGYQDLPAQTRKREAMDKLNAVGREASAIEYAIESVRQELTRLAEPVLEMQRQYRQLPKRYQDSFAAVEQRYREARDANERDAQELITEESAKLRTIDGGFQRQALSLAQEKSQLDSQEQRELAEALQKMRQQHIDARLRWHEIVFAEIPGIGEKLTARLAAAGIRTAADVAACNIRGINGVGQTKASSLYSWAARVRQRAESAAPVVLPSTAADAISANYGQTRRNLESQTESLVRRMTIDRQQVLDDYSGRRRNVHTARTAIDSAFEQDRHSIQRRFEQEKERVEKDLRKKKAEFGERKKPVQIRYEKLAGALFAKRIELSEARRTLTPYQTLTFREYLKRVVGRVN